MNELKPEDVMKALECCSKSNGVDACMSGCPLWETDTCPCVEDEAALMKSALALLREKDATIKDYKKLLDTAIEGVNHARDTVKQKDAEIERLKDLLNETANYNEAWVKDNGELRNALKTARADAINEVLERAEKIGTPICNTWCVTRGDLTKIAKEMKEEQE